MINKLLGLFKPLIDWRDKTLAHKLLISQSLVKNPEILAHKNGRVWRRLRRWHGY